MTHEQQALWHRIRDFAIDEPGASSPYSARLARERGWTPVYAERVVEEYRRFAFLAVVAGHSVTPSKPVDEAWHLHLLYTRNYWEGFCPLALGRPLHHTPSDGNEGSEAHFQDQYEATLASYERLFGTPPPEDVWPRASVTSKRKRVWPFLILAPLLLTGCAEPNNPLDWSGPSFLELFAGLYGVALLFAYVLRWSLRGPDEGPPAADWRLGRYEQAFLNEGPALALATALTHLTATGRLAIDRKTGRMQASPGATPDNPLESAVLRATSSPGGAVYATVRRVVAPVFDDIESTLRRGRLWTSPESMGRSILISAVLIALPLLLGTVKLFIGLSRERPVGFLALGLILGTGLAVFLLRSPNRSRYGDRVLSELRERRNSSPDLATGVALFGLTALAGTPYAYLRPAVVPPASVGSDPSGGSTCGTNSSCSSGCGSSCGGGGCGGCSS